ncbi:hypothetical protein [Peribacillus asahii]
MAKMSRIIRPVYQI